MYRYDNYTDSFVRIDGEPNTGSTTVRVGVPLKEMAIVKKVELTDECIDKIADAVVRKLADRKTENSSEKPNNCEDAENPSGDVWECGCFLDTYCEHQIYDRNPDGTINIVECGYEQKTEPTISKMEQVDKDINVRSKDEPQTCSVNGRPYSECTNCEHFRCTADEPQTETEIAKAIVHKMIDDSVIAEDAYPDLRQKMHDAVDEYEPQTDCPWK